jgi:hypothetical protein
MMPGGEGGGQEIGGGGVCTVGGTTRWDEDGGLGGEPEGGVRGVGQVGREVGGGRKGDGGMDIL